MGPYNYYGPWPLCHLCLMDKLALLSSSYLQYATKKDNCFQGQPYLEHDTVVKSQGSSSMSRQVSWI